MSDVSRRPTWRDPVKAERGRENPDPEAFDAGRNQVNVDRRGARPYRARDRLALFGSLVFVLAATAGVIYSIYALVKWLI